MSYRPQSHNDLANDGFWIESATELVGWGRVDGLRADTENAPVSLPEIDRRRHGLRIRVQAMLDFQGRDSSTGLQEFLAYRVSQLGCRAVVKYALKL
jgi:hypothetical protein